MLLRIRLHDKRWKAYKLKQLKYWFTTLSRPTPSKTGSYKDTSCEFYATTRVFDVTWTQPLWNRMQQLAADWPSKCASVCNSIRDPWINISSRMHCLGTLGSLRSNSSSFQRRLIGCHAQRFILLRFIRLLLLDVFAREIDVVRLTIRARGKYCHLDCSRGRCFRRRRIAVKLTVARPLQRTMQCINSSSAKRTYHAYSL